MTVSTDTKQLEQPDSTRLPGEVVETYIQPIPGEVVETYRQPGRLPGREAPPAPPEEKPAPPPKKRRRGRKVLIVCLIAVGLVALGALGAGAGWLFARYQAEEEPWYYNEDMEQTDEEITIPSYPWGEGASMSMSAEHGEELTAQEIYAKVNPSVVTVMVWLDQGASVGTGVIMSEDGYILTNYHVLAGGNECRIYLDTGRAYDASFVAGDSANDIAVLKVDAQGLPAAEFGDSDTLQVGDQVYAIGNPLGTELRGTFTDGIVSAINRDVEVDGRTMTLIQTNAALNNGNSGGPLINAYGQVVGINTIKMSSSYSTIEGLGFALPTATVTYLVNDLLSCGEVKPEPQLGVMVDVYPTTLPDGNQGILVKTVNPASPAENGGLQEGDVIVSANGQPIESSNALLRVRRTLEVGDDMELTVWRDGEYLQVTLHLTQVAE